MFNKIPIGGRFLIEDGSLLLLEDDFNLLWGYEQQIVSFDSTIANVDFSENLEWKTDIIKAYEGEQRIACRLYPRVEYNYKFVLTEKEYTEFRAILRTWNASKRWLNLLWIDSSDITSISETDVIINFNTETANYKIGNYVAIVEKDGNINLKTIVALSANQLTIDYPFGRDLIDVKIMPTDEVIIPDGFSINRNADAIYASAVLKSIYADNLAVAGNFTQYKQLDVLLELQPVLSGINEKLLKQVDAFDNGQGLIEYVDASAYLFRMLTCNFIKISKSERYTLKRFLHKMKGKRGAFWLPSWNNDIIITTNITSSQTYIIVSSFGYGYFDNGTPSDFIIEMNNGTKYFNRILSTVRGQETERFNLETSFGAAINVANIKRVMFLYKVRFDSDSISFESIENQIFTVSVPVVEVPA